MIGAMFTLMIVGGYAITVLTGVLSGDDVQAYREYRRVEKSSGELSGHYVVAGFGVIGRRVANRLRQQGRTVVVVEFDEDQAKRASDFGYLTVLLAAGRDEALEKARLDTAAALLVTDLEHRPQAGTHPDRARHEPALCRSWSPTTATPRNPGCPMPAHRASSWSTISSPRRWSTSWRKCSHPLSSCCGAPSTIQWMA